jgi:hypothetical protein
VPPFLLKVARSRSGSFLGRPARALVGDQLDRPDLVEADDRTVLGRISVERKHALGLGGEVGVGAPLPGARALVGEAGAVEDPAQRFRGDVDADRGQVVAQLGERPARQRDAPGVGAGARDRHDPIALGGRRLGRAPAPVVRVERVEPPLVELVDHLAHVGAIRAHYLSDLRRRHARRRGQHDHRPLTLGLVLRPPRDRLQPIALPGRQLTHEHLPGDASPPPPSGTCIPVRQLRRVSGQTFPDGPLAAFAVAGGGYLAARAGALSTGRLAAAAAAAAGLIALAAVLETYVQVGGAR